LMECHRAESGCASRRTVTSGLDEQTDREDEPFFRSLVDAGKTVVYITYSLANVERT
jgi:ABC-type multidrug transport system ATPase subunit